jgi:hypothetical protein
MSLTADNLFVFFLKYCGVSAETLYVATNASNSATRGKLRPERDGDRWNTQRRGITVKRTKKSIKRLTLSTETIRNLTPRDLQAVKGGTDEGPSRECVPTYTC